MCWREVRCILTLHFSAWWASEEAGLVFRSVSSHMAVMVMHQSSRVHVGSILES